MAAKGCEPGTPTDPPDSPLRVLAKRVREYGMEVMEHLRSGELTEIVVVNPRDPGLGRAVMSCDGFFTWERFCKFQTADDVQAVAQAIGVLLDENMSRRLISGASKTQAQEHPDR